MLGTPSRRWNWTDSGLVPVLGAAMWATWLAALADTLGSAFNVASPPGTLWPLAWLLLLGGTLVAGLGGRLERNRWIAAIGGLLGVLAAEWWLLYRGPFGIGDARWLAALAVQASQFDVAPLLVAALAAFLWWCGLTIDWLNHDTLMRLFVIGVVVLGLSLFEATRSNPAYLSSLTLSLIVFLLAGWATLALASMSEATHAAGSRGMLKLNRYWLLAVASAIGAIFIIGLVFAALATPAAVARLLANLRPVAAFLSWLLGYVVYAVAYISFLIISPLYYWLRSLTHPDQGPGDPPQPPPPPPNKTFLDQSGGATLSPLAELILRTTTLILMVTLIGWVLAWALRRSSRTDDQGVRESRELIWSWDQWRKRLAEQLARRPRLALFGALAGRPDDPLVWMRAAYRRVLAQAVDRGQPRQPGQTPLGYLPALRALWPGQADNADAVTAAYDAARYGEQPPSAAELEALRQRVDSLLASKEGSK